MIQLPSAPIGRACLSVALATLLSGCFASSLMRPSTHVDYSFATEALPETHPALVAVFASRDSIPGSYVEIALISGAGNPETTTSGDLVRALRRRAAKLGANAIVVLSVHDAIGPTVSVRRGLGLPPPDRSGQALAISISDSIAALGLSSQALETLDDAERRGSMLTRPEIRAMRGMQYVGVQSLMVAYWIGGSCRAWHYAQDEDLTHFPSAEAAANQGFFLSRSDGCQGPDVFPTR